jgi:hypothetical protein
MIKRKTITSAHLLIFAFTLFSFQSFSQVLNSYAKVSSIAGTTLTLTNVSISPVQSFADGDQVIVMQMQDNVLGNATNSNSFGSLSGTGLSAGMYEVATILSHTGGAAFSTITLTAALTNTYNINANADVQVISYHVFGAPNYTTPCAITPLAWNGALGIGGVVAIQVNGNLTLTNNITANGSGFAGGSVSANYYPSGLVCDTVITNWISASNKRGEKGEGVYLRTNSAYRYGKSNIVNGGGGGVNINVGGGGGGNYTAGGISGPGWNSTAGGCPASGVSLGGIALGSQVAGNRVFMGGGGGGGQQNDGVGSSGGAGGGIILIQANQLITTGACGGLSISANGVTPANASNDGAGGGGAGGSIVLNIGSFSVAAGCTLNITANGGNGGSVTDAAVHSGGGGGGQGAVIFSSALPVTNVTTTTNNGAGGFNNSGHTSSASSGSGTNGTVILTSVITPLPIELVLFTGHTEGTANKLIWITMTESNNAYFNLERSADGINFTSFDKINGAGNSTSEHDYSDYDYQSFAGITYYRLKQTDNNGRITYSQIISLDNQLNNISVDNVYPNPTNDYLNFDFTTPLKGTIHTQLFAFTGQLVVDNIQPVTEGKSVIKTNISNCARGIYTLRITYDLTGYSYKTLVIKN